MEAPDSYAIEYYKPAKKPELLPIGSEAPNWTLTNGSGEETSLSDYRGNLVVLDFWGTWCAPCLIAMPHLQQIHERFEERGMAVLGISAREPEDADPAGFARRQGYTYPILLNGDAVAEQYGVSGFPTLYVIGPDGKILDRMEGYGEGFEDELTTLLEERLAE